MKHSIVVCMLLGALGWPAGTVNAQDLSPHFAVDTVMMGNDTIVMFSDKTWEYLATLNFDGVMNHALHSEIMSDSNYQFHLDWNNDMCFTYTNDLSVMRDTIWMCTVDSPFAGWSLPVEGVVVSRFKQRGRRFHKGIDLDLDVGDPVRAAFDGRVRYAQYNKSGFGNLVIIRHSNGLETYYAHLDKLGVQVNQDVKAGEIIGLGGETGRATGPHLHFEVRFYDNALDPELVFDFDNKKLYSENLLIHKGLFAYKAGSARTTVVAHRSSSAGRNTSPASTSTSKATNKSAAYHKVRSGDSLYKIARRYGTTIDELCKINGIKRDDILHVGTTLKLR